MLERVDGQVQVKQGQDGKRNLVGVFGVLFDSTGDSHCGTWITHIPSTISICTGPMHTIRQIREPRGDPCQPRYASTNVRKTCNDCSSFTVQVTG